MKMIDSMHQRAVTASLGERVLHSTAINLIDERKTSEGGSLGELWLTDADDVYRQPMHFDAVTRQAMAEAVSSFPGIEMACLTATGEPGDERWLMVYVADHDFVQADELAESVARQAPIERAMDCLPVEAIDRGLARVLSARSMPFYRRAFGC